ncbi:Retrotransposon gag protein [Abeliophyllum distichum]|uniref:Retrotransposon gag protein n=1 Tax=Abeliophyllum distichum TaxID=126358 RepID=A0ABD1RRS8_9LAMI
MPHKNSDKEPASQRVQSVIERYEEQQNTPGTEGHNQNRYELMTELSPRTMRALLGELTQDVVGQVSLQNVHDMEKFIQNENVHYDNMAKQLSTLNELMNKLVDQICQPHLPSIGNHFHAITIVGHNSPVLTPNQGIELPFMPSTSNAVGGGMTRPNNRPQTIPPSNQPIGVPYDPNMVLRNQIAEIMQDQMAFGMRPFIRPTYRKPYPDWIDQVYPWPRGYKVPEFSLFTGLDEVSTLEHIGRFILQCGELTDYHKMRLFPSSLTGIAFSWFINLSANSVQTWQQ